MNGTFIGNVTAIWLTEPNSEHRRMRLTKDFAFEREGKQWTANTDDVVDGASIPGLLWTAVGPPYVGNYRRASVIHDVYCQRQSESWQDTHWMFFYAMRADHLQIAKAFLMFQAVWRFGPKWPAPLAAREMTAPDFKDLEEACQKAFEELGEDADPQALHNKVNEILDGDKGIKRG